MLRFVIVVALAACGSKRSSNQEDERARLEDTLRREQSRAAVKDAARAYRELMGEAPEALHLVADAFERVGDRQGAIETLQTLVARGHANREHRFRLIDLFLLSTSEERREIDAATYQTNLEWLQRELQGVRECARWMTLVAWTHRRPEEDRSISAALEVCKDDSRRAELFRARAALTKDPEDACQAVVHGAPDLADQCAAAGAGWRRDVADALLGRNVREKLTNAIASREATPYVLTLFARTPEIPVSEACSALTRAEEVELGWSPKDPGHRAATLGRYEVLKRDRGCS